MYFLIYSICGIFLAGKMALDCELYSIGGNAGGMGMALGRCIAALYYRQHYLYLSARIKKEVSSACALFSIYSS
jgi:hypothetical protein